LYKETNIVEDIRIRRLGWAGIKYEWKKKSKDSKKGFQRKLSYHKTSGKTKNKIGGHGSVGCFTTAGKKRREE
jgi:hypothetical protein